MIESKIVWDEERTLHLIRLNPEDVRITPLGNDAVVIVEAGGRQFEAMVPTMSLGQGWSFVPAEQVGRLEDKLVLILPPSNDGTPIWYIREDELDEISFQLAV